MVRFGMAALAAAAMMAAAPAMASERVVNGDFSAGNSGFTTDYSLYPPLDEPNGNYWVLTNPSVLCGSCFPSVGDHTTGTGNMLFLDGAANANSVAWRQSVSVAANSSYVLSFWLANMGAAGPIPNISARVDGSEVLATGPLPYSTGVTATIWNHYTTSFNSGAATSLILSFVDTANTHSYNDFAIDDISLTGAAPTAGVPEPAAWALMLTGFGFAGATLRRRRRMLALQV